MPRPSWISWESETLKDIFLGKCGGLKHSTEIGQFILPIAAIRGEGTSNDYLDPIVPALPSFKLHKFVSEKLVERGYDYRTGVVLRPIGESGSTTRCLGRTEEDDGHRHGHGDGYHLCCRARKAGFPGALLLVSDLPMTPEGVKTEESDRQVTREWADAHLELGIASLSEIGHKGETIKHFQYSSSPLGNVQPCKTRGLTRS